MQNESVTRQDTNQSILEFTGLDEQTMNQQRGNLVSHLELITRKVDCRSGF